VNGVIKSAENVMFVTEDMLLLSWPCNVSVSLKKVYMQKKMNTKRW